MGGAGEQAPGVGRLVTWSPREYMRFGDERTRPSVDLVARIAVDAPRRVIDLGCGPGNSTQVLAARWPGASIVGLDSSEAMIQAARAEYPGQDWALGSIETWADTAGFDVVFSNAALQWVPDHGPLMERLFGAVSPGGALAFQVPSADYALVRTLIHDIARSGPWAGRMSGPLNALTMHPPAFYYDHLTARATGLDMWETEYLHVLESPDAIVDWILSTGLRPFMEALETGAERELFVDELRVKVRESYTLRADGKVLFPFKRMFVVAYA